MNQDRFKKQLANYPTIADLARRAEGRIPRVSWAYLSGGTGDEALVARNRQRLADITLTPRFLKGEQQPDLSTTLLGQTYQAPFGIAPVGLGGLIWPRVEIYLAQTAARYQIPYTLSTVASQTPETIGPQVGNMGWFQLYPPRFQDLREDILSRAQAAGFQTLVVTADVPAPSRRERMRKAGFVLPPRLTPSLLLQGAMRPSWALATLMEGLPSLRTVEKYMVEKGIRQVASFAGGRLGGTLSWTYLQEVRDWWSGPLVLKGILHPADAERALNMGIDAIWVSNHGGRQFNGAPAAIEALPAIVKQLNGRAPVIFDSGIRSGLDIIRALALGADFVFLGRPFMYGVAAFGASGGDHVAEILRADLLADMAQLGIDLISEIQADLLSSS